MGTYSLNIQFHLKNEKEKTSAYTGFSLALDLQKEVPPPRASNTNKRKSRTPTQSRASLPHLVASSAHGTSSPSLAQALGIDVESLNKVNSPSANRPPSPGSLPRIYRVLNVYTVSCSHLLKAEQTHAWRYKYCIRKPWIHSQVCFWLMWFS